MVLKHRGSSNVSFQNFSQLVKSKLDSSFSKEIEKELSDLAVLW